MATPSTSSRCDDDATTESYDMTSTVMSSGSMKMAPSNSAMAMNFNNSTSSFTSSSSRRRLLTLDDEMVRLFDPARYSRASRRRRSKPLPLFGRDAEQRLLREAFQRTIATRDDGGSGSFSPSSIKQELILFSGPSGSGKTALTNHTLRPLVAATPDSFFLSGKFDPNKRGTPYHVFCHALTQYATILVEESSPKQLAVIRESLTRAVGSEVRMLVPMIPALENILFLKGGNIAVVEEGYHRAISTTQASIQPEAIHRFRFVFLNLMRAICQHHPVVLFLDDLQWADTASLELVRALLLHLKGVPLLLVGAHRTTTTSTGGGTTSSTCSASEGGLTSSIASTTTAAAATSPPAFSPLLETIKEWKRMSACVQIELQPLSEEHVNQLLSELLHHTQDHTLPLADVVSSQTHGNPFHVLQFLRLLKDQGFLYLEQQDDNINNDPEEQQVWCWNREEINSQRLHAGSVLELVKEKLQKLPRFVQELLRVASCMGDQVDDSALAIVVGCMTSLHDSLQTAAKAGFLLFVPQTGGYRFAHDRIQEAAYQSIENKAEFLLKVGRKLWKSSPSKAALESNVFLVAGLMNKGSSLPDAPPLPRKERYRLAELNLIAGKQALALASFHDAFIYFDKGVSLLGGDNATAGPWKTTEYYPLCLELYSLHANIMVWKADYVRVQQLIGTIFEHTSQKPLEDRLAAYSTLIHCLGQQGDYALAVETGLDVLDKLGYSLPKREPTKMVVARELVRTKMALRGKTNNYILNKLGPMTNPKKKNIAKFLNELFLICYSMRSPYAPILAFRSIRLCLRYGLDEGCAAIAFATYGAILCGVTRQVREGYRWGQLAVSLMESHQQKELLPKVYVVVVTGIHHWTMPLKESMDKFKFAHRTGMETGDVATSLLNAVVGTWYSFFSGTPLGVLQQESDEYTTQLEVHKQENVLLLQKVVCQMIANFCGRAPSATILEGPNFDLEERLEEATTTHNGTAVIAIHLCSSVVAYVFGDYERAALHAQEADKVTQKPTATYMVTVVLFYMGLSYVALAKKEETSKRQRRHYLKVARRNQRLLMKYAKDSPWNFKHKAQLLDAELKSCSKKKGRAECMDNTIFSLYHHAIQGAKREGFVQEAAMACELAADYIQSYSSVDESTACTAKALAERYLTHAHGLYLRWGSTAKAAALVPWLAEVSGDFSQPSGEFFPPGGL